MKKKNNKTIYINTNLITNFKPNIFRKTYNFKNLKTTKKQIYCKNFFLYLLLMKYNSLIFNSSNLYLKKHKKKVFTILRSPYRHKLARHQICVNRYHINHSIKINLKNIIFFNNWKKIIFFFNYIKKINLIFESNIIYTTNVCISIPIKFNVNFLKDNFKK